MPELDLPLSELKEYRGSSPCPDDFDLFWEKAVSEVEALGTGCNFRDAGFKSLFAKCRHLYFQGVGGSRIHVKAILPFSSSIGKTPALLNFHGYSASSAPWAELLSWTAAGIAVFAMDCRGQGGFSEDLTSPAGPTLYGNIVKGLGTDPAANPENLHYRAVFQDTLQLARIVMSMDEIDEKKVGAFGVSQGGALTLACAALEPRISCLAPLYPYLSDYRRVWEMDMDKRAYVGLSDYFRKFDPLHEYEDDIFNTLGYIDVSNLSSRIRGNVLFGATLMDDICPPSTQFAVFNRIEASKEMLLYKDYGHERIPNFIDRRYEFLVNELSNSE